MLYHFVGLRGELYFFLLHFVRRLPGGLDALELCFQLALRHIVSASIILLKILLKL